MWLKKNFENLPMIVQVAFLYSRETHNNAL